MTDPAPTSSPTINIIKEDLPQSQVYDEAFTVTKQRWGTFVSHSLDGEALITSLSLEGCVDATRWYLKATQEGFSDNARVYDGSVGGKL